MTDVGNTDGIQVVLAESGRMEGAGEMGQSKGCSEGQVRWSRAKVIVR